jgi:hypothetical protein
MNNQLTATVTTTNEDDDSSTTTQVPFRFGCDSDGNYGYILKNDEGADSVIPFKKGYYTYSYISYYGSGYTGIYYWYVFDQTVYPFSFKTLTMNYSSDSYEDENIKIVYKSHTVTITFYKDCKQIFDTGDVVEYTAGQSYYTTGHASANKCTIVLC